MKTKLLQYILLAAIAGGITMLAFGMWIAGSIVTVIAVALLIFWWRLYKILRISESLGKEDIEGAKKQMSAIKDPEKLNDYSKTYYNFFKGIIDTKENRFKEAEAAFRTALQVNRFRAADEKATAHLMIGQLLLRKRNRVGGKRHLQEAKSLTTNPQILDQIKMLARQSRIKF